MGDSGALLIGFVLAVIPLLGAPGMTAIEDLAAPATLLMIPILDTILAIGRRVRQKRAIYSPDKEHIHHRLLAVGMKDTSILMLVYFACVLFGAAAIGSLFMNRLSGLVLMVCLWATVSVGIGVIDGVRRKKRTAAQELVGKP